MEGVGRSLSVGSLIYGEIISSFKWVNSRLSYFKDLETENLKLKLRVAYLQKMKQITSNLQTENSALRKILNVTEDIKRNFVTAKVIGMSNSLYASSALLQSGFYKIIEHKIKSLSNQDTILNSALLLGQKTTVLLSYVLCFIVTVTVI